ncbi:MAG: alpha-L-rhamnosidase [Synoicihabitans sp.]
MKLSRIALLSGALIMALISAPDSSAASSVLNVTHLRCEDTDMPQLVDTSRPRFSWRLDSDRRGVTQSAYQIRVQSLNALGEASGSSITTGWVKSDQSQWVSINELVCSPQTRYQWQVRVRDDREEVSEWSDVANFETALLDTPWKASWISDGRPVAKETAPPARYLRKDFSLSTAPVRARLYLSSFGMAEPWLNGARVTPDYFLPGWPDYRKRNLYVSYDVTDQLTSGDNTIGIALGDGWYSGTLFLEHQYDEIAKVSAWIEITHANGETQLIATDDSWRWSEGPIRAQGVYFGETYDAREELEGWATPAAAANDWQPVVTLPRVEIPLHARHSPPVRRIEELHPQSATEIRPGVFIYDLGQNMVGWVRLKLNATPGQEVKLRFAEMLEADGEMHTANLRKAEATARYITKGGGKETWEPTFTFFGFRYVELTGVTKPREDAISGVVVHSDLERIGHFESSDPLLNKLYANTLWGQKGNFLELPTDCPQRDERLGWTGDAQVFAHTAHYNLRSGAFYRQWMAAVRDSFEPGPKGGFGSVAPHIGFQRGAAGWSDAGAIVPWVNWLHTADRRLLEESFSSVQDWIALQEESAPDGIRISREGWGDWLAPGYEPKKAPTPYVLIATAYFAHSTQLAIQMADILEKPAIAARYRTLHAKIKAAFNREFITPDGRITSDEQTAYLLALTFDLVEEDLRAKMGKHLQRAVAEKDNHLATGFIGTPLLVPTLHDIGRTDLAYTVLQKETYPGWLYSVKNGATTIWERWDSWTPEIGFNPGGMNSFNHYAYGSVVGWFYDTIAGIKPREQTPGWKEFILAPHPGGNLTHAAASLESPFGLIASQWQLDDRRFEWAVTVPPNTTAHVSLPAVRVKHITESGHALSELASVTDIVAADETVSFLLGSGSYQFTVTDFPALP